MNRRIAIKQFIIFSAGIALLPSCKNERKKVSAYNNLPVYEDDEALLAAVAEIILPDTSTPGAKQMQSHLFALQMMNDCYKADERERFLQQMNTFKSDVKKKFNKNFLECNTQEQQTFLGSLNNSKDGNDAVSFYKTYKRLVVQSYTSSKYYLTNVDVYKLIPGKYIPSVHV